LPEALIKYLMKYRMDKTTGKATFAVVQAEDEIAAIGMVVGAGWAGARAMTSSSGPGISLMSEFAGLSYYAEVPAVVFDVQRIGPSTGLPTRTSQGDIFSTILNSHGDTEHLALIPGSMEECYSMAIAAFDLAERAQTLVFVLMDLDLGMNTWMSPVFPYPEKPIDRGKVLDAAKVKELGATWGRYKDVDGDGIPWRTIPGTEGPAYFTRGSGHNAMANYSERPDDYVANMDRLHKKFETAKHLVPAPIIQLAKDAKVGIIAFGSSHFAVEESRDQLKEETGLETSYLRLRAYPFPAEVEAFIRQHDRVYVIDQNRDGQMLKLLTMVGDSKLAPKLRSIRHYSGLPIDARGITDNLLAQERAK
jgi:2-oxoglutarate ferredoxin oxidoreductase subunit alpha